MDLKQIEIKNNNKDGSLSSVLMKYFTKEKETISRREFLELLIVYYINRPIPLIQEIDRVYNSSMQRYLVAKNLDHTKNSFEKMPAARSLSPELKKIIPKEVGRIGEFINDLKDFVFTFKEFEITKKTVQECIENRKYTDFFYNKHSKGIDKTFYDMVRTCAKGNQRFLER